MAKRVVSVFMAIVTLVSFMSIAAEAVSLTVSELNLGYMVPTNTKGTKNLTTVNLYGDYDYINFYINAKKNNACFVYEIYADKGYTKLKDSGAVDCDKGKYNIPAKINFGEVFYITIFGIISAVVSSWIASRNIMKFQVSEVLRDE